MSSILYVSFDYLFELSHLVVHSSWASELTHHDLGPP